MKVIFFDIDGVLNCSKTPNPRNLPYIADPALVTRFARLLDRSGAVAVMTSSWRIDPAGLFSARHWGIPFQDIVPDMPDQSRDREIRAWLEANAPNARFVVLDDGDDDLDDMPLFQPSSETGLTDDIARGIEDYLAGRSGQDMRKNVVARAYEHIAGLLNRNRD
jgi:hypothetical protein